MNQEPIARVTGTYGGRFVVEPLNPAMVLPTNMALYAESQPKREWVGLTDEEVVAVWHEANTLDELVRITEAKLKEKNA